MINLRYFKLRIQIDNWNTNSLMPLKLIILSNINPLHMMLKLPNIFRREDLTNFNTELVENVLISFKIITNSFHPFIPL